MNKRKIITILLIPVLAIGAYFTITGLLKLRQIALEHTAERAAQKAEQEKIQNVLDKRISDSKENTDPLGEDDRVKILLIGLDKRAGQENGHCDAIQLLDINKKTESITITAVPRGTYSPLPPGKGTTSSDYYVSNACGLAGLDYGINQIERILGQKADHIVVVGFSEVFGILRTLKLPTTDTIQWLRQRQGYAIGEPQRARNHSTFLKTMLTRHIPSDRSATDTALGYLIYKIVHTDLSFEQAKLISDALIDINPAEHRERITLAMKPAYDVKDIPYDEENIQEHLGSTIGVVKNWLPKDDYAGLDETDVQQNLINLINQKEDEPEFITWVFNNKLWLQIDNDGLRETAHITFIQKYIEQLETTEERQAILADYILEMENRGEDDWRQKGEDLLKKEIN